MRSRDQETSLIDFIFFFILGAMLGTFLWYALVVYYYLARIVLSLSYLLLNRLGNKVFKINSDNKNAYNSNPKFNFEIFYTDKNWYTEFYNSLKRDGFEQANWLTKFVNTITFPFFVLAYAEMYGLQYLYKILKNKNKNIERIYVTKLDNGMTRIKVNMKGVNMSENEKDAIYKKGDYVTYEFADQNEVDNFLDRYRNTRAVIFEKGKTAICKREDLNRYLVFNWPKEIDPNKYKLKKNVNEKNGLEYYSIGYDNSYGDKKRVKDLIDNLISDLSLSAA